MSFKTLILAAGAGTRMRSAIPKVAHELLGKPLVRWVVDAAKAAGSDECIAVVGSGRELVAPLLGDVTLAVQEQLLGIGHAVMMAAPALAEFPADASLLVLSGDTPLVRPQTLASLVALREGAGAAASLLSFKPQSAHGYGRILRGAGGAFQGIVEEKDASDAQREIGEVNSGIYCFRLGSLLEVLGELDAENAQGEYYLTDCVGLLAQAVGGVEVCILEDASETLGINDRSQLAIAAAVARERINHAHMLAGVTMLDPQSVWIGPDVCIEPDVEVLPMTIIYGSCQIGRGSVIGPNTRLNNATIGKDCVVDESIVIDSILEDRVSTGPRAYLRPGTVMRQGSRAGTHVEIKKSEIGQNSKVPHLSYIGDAVLGEDVNIGAGSITCNYDGVQKNRTSIGDRCFVGSDTMFVAPVELGPDAVTGAGSVITKDVPGRALAIARPKQCNVEGYKTPTEEKEGDCE